MVCASANPTHAAAIRALSSSAVASVNNLVKIGRAAAGSPLRSKTSPYCDNMNSARFPVPQLSPAFASFSSCQHSGRRKSEGHNEECRLYEGRKEIKKGSEGRK